MKNRNVLIKPASGICNLRCEYCFYSDEMNNRCKKSYGFMKEETLKNIIRKTIEASETECTIAYQGGEPTVRGLEFFEKSMELQERYNHNNRIRIHNAIQTNGILIDNKWLAFLKKNNFLVGISLDGNEYTHDRYRKDVLGHGSYKKVKQTISLLKKYGINYNILTVVTPAVAKSISGIYEDYKANSYRYLQFIPCIDPKTAEKGQAAFSLTSKQYGYFLKTLFDLWYTDIRKGNYVSISQFENYIMLLMRQMPYVCGMTGICGLQNIVEADGGVYPCDFYVMDEYLLGNLNYDDFDTIDIRRRNTGFIEKSIPMHTDCNECKYKALCRNGCKRYREPFVDGAYQKNVFCDAYYDFFEYSILRLEELARKLQIQQKGFYNIRGKI